MHIPVALNDIRVAILRGHRMTFNYERTKIVADFYLLGQARKTGAYVVAAWCIEPVQQWRHFRYSLIQDLEPIGRIDVLRDDFNVYDRVIATIDTLATLPRVRQPHN
jgi:predicted DNA-binding transcriptional regulator YafY